MSIELFDGLVSFPVTLEVRGFNKDTLEGLRESIEAIIGREIGVETFSTFLLSESTMASERSRESFRTLVRLRPTGLVAVKRRFGFK